VHLVTPFSLGWGSHVTVSVTNNNTGQFVRLQNPAHQRTAHVPQRRARSDVANAGLLFTLSNNNAMMVNLLLLSVVVLLNKSICVDGIAGIKEGEQGNKEHRFRLSSSGLYVASNRGFSDVWNLTSSMLLHWSQIVERVKLSRPGLC
jgi:hypothetical protein